MKLIKLFSREYSVQYTEASIRSLGPEVYNHIPALLLSQCYLPEPPNETCYGDPEEWKSLIATLRSTFIPGPALEEFMNRFHQYGKEYVTTSTRLGSGASLMTTEELITAHQEYQRILILYSAYLWMGYLLNNTYTDEAKTILDVKNIPHRTDVETTLLSPSKKTGILAAQTALWNIKQTDGTLSDSAADILLRQYAWMSCLDIHNGPWTSADVHSFFENVKMPMQCMTVAEATKAAGLTPEEQQFFQFVRDLVFVKDMRDEYRRKGIYGILPLFDALAQRVGLTREEIAFFTSEEIIDALKNGSTLDRSIANERKAGFMTHWNGSTIVATTNSDEIRRFMSDNIQGEIPQTSEVLKGTPACLGKVRGTVKIVRGIADLAKVQSGDIMVAITTHPDFVPAMHRAAAIVTDEGGLTSHAAIVARELKIPCIVGTKNATQILHDGDSVEVDAAKGVITPHAH